MNAEESTLTGHEPCPKCGSRDNLARYSDGHGYCFGCSYWEAGTDQKVSHKTQTKKVAGMNITDREYLSLPNRRLTEETCRKYKYSVAKVNGRSAQVADYYRDGKLLASKCRFKGKDFLFSGEDTKRTGLYGQQLFRGGKMLTICEGEIDTLSMSQIQGNKWAVVGIPKGAPNAAAEVCKELEFVNSFDKVVIMFDMDEAGQAGAMEVAQMVAPGKAHIASLPMKDVNDMLVAGRGQEAISAMWDAKPYRPDGLISVTDIIEEALVPPTMGLSWGFSEMDAVTYGRRRGEVYMLGAGSGCGKTTWFKQLIHQVSIVEQNKVGLILLEESPAHSMRTLAGLQMGKRLHVPGVEYDQDELRECLNKSATTVTLYDHFGAMGWDIIKEKIRYMAKGLGIKDIFLDHLTALVASVDRDERKAIDSMMADMGSLVKELDISLYVISHLNRAEGKPHEEGGRVQEKHFRGSGSIGFWSHFIFAIERDKQDQSGAMQLRCLKDRYTGDANGFLMGLHYNRDTGFIEQGGLPDLDGKSENYGFNDETQREF